MEFRWIAILALWTLLVGPVFNSAVNHGTQRGQSAAAVRTPPPTTQR
jgi:hypothetical protein